MKNDPELDYWFGDIDPEVYSFMPFGDVDSYGVYGLSAGDVAANSPSCSPNPPFEICLQGGHCLGQCRSDDDCLGGVCTEANLSGDKVCAANHINPECDTDSDCGGCLPCCISG